MKKLMIYFTLMFLALSGVAATEPADGGVNAYYYAAYLDTAEAESRLKSAGFDIVGHYAATAKSETLIITNSALQTAAGKPGRGFGAILRVLVDGEHQRIAVTNPVYFGKAFLQQDYDPVLAEQLTTSLTSALGTMSASEDSFAFDKLEGYHFMIGMPYYEDTYDLAEGDTAALVSKLDTYNGGKNIVFKLSVGEGKTLVGFALSDDTKAFVDTIGQQNAEILPYTILVEEGKAKALAAKYYIAISYPMLTMGEFMRIVNTPGAIEKELSTPFK
ncbi:hypothetical protein WCX49_12860 [Sulfurimonas sp. HSL-1656]|uniref:hypothetical protein n=1 Tax=Thiomicrolovo subterrani TaxID=3131934 RepID=UPI0031F815FA